MRLFLHNFSRGITVFGEFFLLIAVFFVGDFSVIEIKMGPLIVLFALIYYFIKNTGRHKDTGVSLLIGSIFFLSIAFSSAVNYADGIYQFWYLIPMLSILFIRDALSINPERLWLAIVSLVLLLILLQLYWLSSGGVRGRAIFGPNVLYRVFIFLAIISYFRMRGLISLVIIFFCGFGIVLTGSRGGMVVGIIVLIAIILSSPRMEINKNFFFIILLFPLLFYFFLPKLGIIDFVLQRLFLLSGGSIDGRLEFVYIAIDFLSSGFFDLIFGLGVYPNEILNFYPHNIFIELLLSHGILPVFLFLLISIYISLYSTLMRKKITREQRFLFVTFVLFFSSSQFSGSFYDNWVCMPLAFSLFGSYFKIRRI